MANKSRVQVITELKALNVEFDENGEYKALCELLTSKLAEAEDKKVVAETQEPPVDAKPALASVNGSPLVEDAKAKETTKSVAPEKLAPLNEAEMAEAEDIASRCNNGRRLPAPDEMLRLGRLKARARANDQKL